MLLPETTHVTRADLDRYPDDGQRRELIAGELFVSPRPSARHQRVMLRLGRWLLEHEEQHGGHVLIDTNNDYSDGDHMEPDLAYVAPEHEDRLTPMGVSGPPDLVVEISSPSTRSYDLVRKRRLYEKQGVPEYWFVDLDEDAVVAHRLDGDHYAIVEVHGRGGALTSPLLPGLAFDVDGLLGSDGGRT